MKMYRFLSLMKLTNFIKKYKRKPILIQTQAERPRRARNSIRIAALKEEAERQDVDVVEIV